jgi:hypothetical protein
LAFRDWVASRNAAGITIDMQTCDLWWEHAQILDLYGLFRAEGTFTKEHQVGRVFFARSPDSDGPVCEYNLSPAQHEAMHARIERGDSAWDELPFLSELATSEATKGAC